MTRKALSNVCFVVAALFFVVDLRTSTWSEASLVSEWSPSFWSPAWNCAGE